MNERNNSPNKGNAGNKSKKKVTVIEPVMVQLEEANALIPEKLKVAAYARVSTEQDEQQSSYEAQVKYYTRYIKNNPEWEFVGVFSDEGITGTSTKNREGFKRMIQLAKSGGIDLILTKSISRFARNTVDTLQTVRELKSANVEVIFEKENLHTFDPKCEMMLTIMSSLAQEESRSISENVRWGKQKSMQEGNVSMPYRRFLGYRKGEDGRPEIVEEEAEIVRRIYTMFLDGKTIRQIGEQLTSDGIPTPAGKKVWSVSTIKSILTNEKYRGDALLQKTYTVDYLSKEKRKNQGEVKQYLVENSHEPIIDPETFDKVQEKMKVHSANRRKLKSRRGLAHSIICGECGAYYGRKVWHNNSNTKRYDVWYCNHKYGKDKEGSCRTPVLKESEIGKAFTEAMTKSGKPNPTYSEERWKEMVETATVFTDRSMVIEWRDGGKTTVQI